MARLSYKTGKNEVQLPLAAMYTQAEVWNPPVISDLPQWPTYGRVSIDVETRDDKLTTLGPGVRRGAYIVGYSFAIEDGPSYYIPLRHATGDNVTNPEAALQYLRDQAAQFRGVLVGANLQYDLDFLAEIGVVFSPLWFRDVQVADPLIWELHQTYSLEDIAVRQGLMGKDEAELRLAASDWGVNPKKELWKLPGRFASNYAKRDVILPLEILRKQERMIESEDIQAIFDLESKVLPVLLRMRRRGVLIDQAQLQRVEDFAVVECLKSLEVVLHHTQRRVSMDDLMKNAALAPVIKAAGFEVGVTSDGKPHIDKAVLEGMKHPVGDALARARRLYKLKNTFVASIRDHMTNGRIHPTFNQLRGSSSQDDDIVGEDDEMGARYGRLSSCDPNIQQQPSRDPEFAKMWRSIYLPEPGTFWAACDFSQQEPRVLTHYAEKLSLSKAKEFGDMYRNDPKVDTYDGLSAMTKTKRKDTKIIYLGLSYSMGPPKLCRLLGLPTVWRPNPKTGRMQEYAGPEGTALFEAFHKGAPFIRLLDYKIRDAVQDRGYIRTLLGRKLHFPAKAEPTQNPWTGRMEKYDWAQKGLNRLIQGSSADQVKKSLVDLDATGAFLQLQVHDEIDGSIQSREEGLAWGEVMRNSVRLTVPMRVDVEVGSSWGGSMG